MLVKFLGFIHHGTTLLFGVYISAAFLGIRMSRKNILTLFGFSFTIGMADILSYILLGADTTEQLYPLIIHLPFILFLTLFYKFRGVLSALSLFTAYLYMQISNWCGLAALSLTHSMTVYYCVRIIVTLIVFMALIYFVSDIAILFLPKSTKALLIFGIMPFVYYVFDYATTVYSKLLYSGLEIVVEFLGFILCISYTLFLFLYLKQYEETSKIEQHNQLMKMQQQQSEKEIEAMRRSEYAISLLRHDMRHFFSNISAFIENGENEKAKAYIREIIDAYDKTAMHKYCKCEIINMILSSHENKLKDNEISFQYSIRLPEKLPFSDVDITCILSNGLENAIQAVLPLDVSKRYINLDLHMNGDKLLISIKNTFAKKPLLINGLPQTKEAGHGFGTKSICYVAEKLEGSCRFSVSGELFVLQVIL